MDVKLEEDEPSNQYKQMLIENFYPKYNEPEAAYILAAISQEYSNIRKLTFSHPFVITNKLPYDIKIQLNSEDNKINEVYDIKASETIPLLNVPETNELYINNKLAYSSKLTNSNKSNSNTFIITFKSCEDYVGCVVSLFCD